MNLNTNTEANPYSASKTSMDAGIGQTYDPQVFSLTGRIGRLRYLAYNMAFSLLCLVVFAGLAGVIASVAQNEIIAMVGTGLAWLAMAAAGLIVARRRLHDLNHTGWFAILQLIPFVNFFFGLYLLFAPGTRGGNRYGAEPAPNNTVVIVLACLLPLVFIVGILAAVAIPAYSAYNKKVQFTEVILATNGAKIGVEICAQDVLGGQSGPLPIKGCGGGKNGLPPDILDGKGVVASVVTQDNGVITATASVGNGLNGETYILIPEFREGRVFWTVEGTCKTNSPKIC